MCISLKINFDSKKNLHLQITSELLRLISEGLIPSGYALPSTRLLSEHLNVSRNTVIRAYENLADIGVIEARPPYGSFVSDTLPKELVSSHMFHSINVNKKRYIQINRDKTSKTKPSGKPLPSDSSPAFDFQYSEIHKDLTPWSSWRKISTNILRTIRNEMSQFDPPGGCWKLRKAIANYLGPSRNIAAKPEQIIITSSLQQSFSVIAQVLTRPNSRVVLESPGHLAWESLLKAYKARSCYVHVDSEGMRVDKLPFGETAFAVVTTGRQFPLGGELPKDRKQRLLEWALESDAFIVEANIFNDYHFSNLLPTSLAGEDPNNRTFYISSFSPTLGGGVRIGYIVAPLEMVEEVEKANAFFGNTASWLDQNVLATFLQTGLYKTHLLKLRKEMMERKKSLFLS